MKLIQNTIRTTILITTLFIIGCTTKIPQNPPGVRATYISDVNYDGHDDKIAVIAGDGNGIASDLPTRKYCKSTRANWIVQRKQEPNATFFFLCAKS